MIQALEEYIEVLLIESSKLPESRRKLLEPVARYLQNKRLSGEQAKLNFICTHNSRRSHMAQIWAATAAYYYERKEIMTFSGGTEATAFNPRAIEAIRRAGFIVRDPGGSNPHYEITFAEDQPPLICFSKTYDHPANPDHDFAAIMTCSDAEQNCPVIPGAEERFAVTYIDPKESDGTSGEAQVYDQRCKQIATEMFYLMNKSNQ